MRWGVKKEAYNSLNTGGLENSVPMVYKNFKNWHKIKHYLHNKKERPFFHEGEVWFCSLGENIGFEQDGRGKEFMRPVVIVKKFNKEVCWGLPLTKSPKKGKYYFSCKLNGENSTIILSQLKLIDSKRLNYSIGSMLLKDLSRIKKHLRELLAWGVGFTPCGESPKAICTCYYTCSIYKVKKYLTC